MTSTYCTTKEQLRKAVTRRLQAKEISTRNLQNTLKISKSHIQRLSQGDEMVSFDVLFALARYFNIAYKFQFPEEE